MSRKVQKLHGFQASPTMIWSRGLMWELHFPSNGLATPGMTSVSDFARTKREAHRANARRISGSQSNVRHPFQAAYHSNIDQTISVHPAYRVHPSINIFRLAFDSQGIAVPDELGIRLYPPSRLSHGCSSVPVRYCHQGPFMAQ